MMLVDCPCGCGDCSTTCTPDCGNGGQRCPDGQCLGELMRVYIDGEQTIVKVEANKERNPNGCAEAIIIKFPDGSTLSIWSDKLMHFYKKTAGVEQTTNIKLGEIEL